MLSVDFNESFFRRGSEPEIVCDRRVGGKCTHKSDQMPAFPAAGPNPWSNGTNATPYDQEFFLQINLSLLVALVVFSLMSVATTSRGSIQIRTHQLASLVGSSNGGPHGEVMSSTQRLVQVKALHLELIGYVIGRTIILEPTEK